MWFSCVDRVWFRGLAAASVLSFACGGPTTPTQVPPPLPVTPDPPKITCPVSQTAQSPDGASTPVTFAAPIVVNGQVPVTTTCTFRPPDSFSVGQKTVVDRRAAAYRTAAPLRGDGAPARPKLLSTRFSRSATQHHGGRGRAGGTPGRPARAMMSAAVPPVGAAARAQRHSRAPAAATARRSPQRRSRRPVDKRGRSPGEVASDPATLMTVHGR